MSKKFILIEIVEETPNPIIGIIFFCVVLLFVIKSCESPEKTSSASAQKQTVTVPAAAQSAQSDATERALRALRAEEGQRRANDLRISKASGTPCYRLEDVSKGSYLLDDGSCISVSAIGQRFVIESESPVSSIAGGEFSVTSIDEKSQCESSGTSDRCSGWLREHAFKAPNYRDSNRGKERFVLQYIAMGEITFDHRNVDISAEHVPSPAQSSTQTLGDSEVRAGPSFTEFTRRLAPEIIVSSLDSALCPGGYRHNGDGWTCPGGQLISAPQTAGQDEAQPTSNRCQTGFRYARVDGTPGCYDKNYLASLRRN
jgi:hypothetical protein